VSLHPDSLVVRGGTVRDPQTLYRKVQEAVEDGDGPVISVFCDVSRTDETAGMSLTELCGVSLVVHTKVQVSMVSRLQACGFELVRDVSNGQPFTHHHVVLAEPVQESVLGEFINCFDEPAPNPAGGMKRRSM
jgi:hypothetical protein